MNEKSEHHTWIASTGMEPSFLNASFKSVLLLIVGNLYSPSAATSIVTCCTKLQMCGIIKASLFTMISNAQM
jgi:hypothetical protein